MFLEKYKELGIYTKYKQLLLDLIEQIIEIVSMYMPCI